MPARQPFTALCQATAPGRCRGLIDLHVHTTHSDGTYSPSQVVELARLSGLGGLAVTDHDTLAGVEAARAAVGGSGLEIVSGVEISAEFRGREFHLLGYFTRLDDGPLLAALDRLRRHRDGRYREMIERLRVCGLSLDEIDLPDHAENGALGRRHLAAYLVKTRQVGSIREAFARYLGDGGRATVPKLRLPVAEAIDLVRRAGGVAGWAHPSPDHIREALAELRPLGLAALEVEYPGFRPRQVREFRGLAAEHGLAITGGSDCHGPGNPRRQVGARGVTRAELETLRQLASS